LASPMLLAAALTSWPDEPDQQASPALLGAKVALVALVIAVAAVGLLFTPEGATPTMTRPMPSGPFMGIFTTPAEADRLTAIQDDLVGLSRTPRTVFLERFPLGYLLEGMRPGTYSTWATSATSDRLQTYIDATGKTPRRIVLTRFGADLQDGEFPESVNLRGIERYRETFRSDELVVLDLTAPQ
ncbi:MAG: hypothetical protein HY876_03900, partial [Coriobacteriales bacterium]|nr:hypothetical protein [Coriobacteriales bacterium]